MAFYTRTIEIDSVKYKQVTPEKWQNLTTGEIVSNTAISIIIKDFKTRQVPVAPVEIVGACCKDGLCVGEGVTTQSVCASLGGAFYPGGTCFLCQTGVFCSGTGVNQTCFGLGHRGQSLTNNFIVGGSCESCILGACCTGGTCLGGGLTSQAACSSAGGIFYAGATCTKCDFGVYCTGSTCFGLGYRGQEFTDNFIPGGTCSECLLGACCEIVNGVLQCSEKTQSQCSNGCFKGIGTVCGSQQTACDSCVHCCFGNGICRARSAFDCTSQGGIYFEQGQGCTSCEYGVCSTDNPISQRYFGNGCEGVFLFGGRPLDLDQGVYCTGSGLQQSCLSTGYRYEQLSNNFIVGATCSSCILGACCTGGTCAGITSQARCNQLNGLFFAGQTCGRCDFGVYCTGAGNDRICIRTGYRGEALSSEFTVGATCSRCTMGTCCVNGERQVGVRQSDCIGTFFPGIFNQNACDRGSCCVGSSCTEDVFRYNCAGIFNSGMTCIACSSGACCLPGGGCTTGIAMGPCLTQGGTFYGGAACSACDTGSCCNGSNCQEQRRGDICTGNFYVGVECESQPCLLGACCVGATCYPDLQERECDLLSGTHFVGSDCSACVQGAICLLESEENGNRTCEPNMYQGELIDGSFYGGQGCSACEFGSCCTGGICTEQIRGDCVGNFYVGITCGVDPCTFGTCCTGATCFGTAVDRRGCQILGGDFYAGQNNCNACATGAYCVLPQDPNDFVDHDCELDTFGNRQEICPSCAWGFGATCSYCDIGSCCKNLLSGGGGTISIRGNCTGSSNQFFKGETLQICATGVFCTGSNEGQTCFGLGYRGQSLTNNFIAGATCNACILGACCTGGTCLGGGLTSQAACSQANGLFYAGRTCNMCDLGVYCTGATCLSLGFRGQSLSNNFIQGATCSSCILGACCTGGTCLGGGLTSQVACSVAGGLFYPGATCRSCDFGVYCTGATCLSLGYRAQALSPTFIQDATCSSCIFGACCTGGTCLNGRPVSQAACSIAGGSFYVGATCFQCDMGVYCTGSGIGQTCFGLGHRGQSLTNNFIAGATCSSCILGACCTGGTCLGGGLTSEAACSRANGLFYAGTTCISCQYGVYCTGSDENTSCLGNGYIAENLSNQFIINGDCNLDCKYGSCCDGITCLGITSARNCPSPYFFFWGLTCDACDTGIGACCTGGNSFLSNSTQCNAANGTFFPEASLVVCATGSCCTGGTCIEELMGRSGNCELFIEGTTCGICDTGVFCTGATCLELGFRGESLSSNFIQGATCASCILGACCTGGNSTTTTVIGCNTLGGIFFPGGSSSLCALGSCCTGGTCTQEIAGRSGNCELFVQGADCSACDAGVFCTGSTCFGLGFRGQELATVFFAGETCSSCIQGICCKENYEYSQIAGGKEHTIALTPYGEVRGFGGNTYGQSGMTLALGYTGIAAGFYHTLALKNNGTVTAWGRNQYGQSTIPSGLTGVAQVAAGEYHSIALKSNGTVAVWGWTGQGQGDIPVGLTGVTMIAAGAGHNLALKQDGTVVAWGYNFDTQTDVPTGLTGVIQVAAGYHHSLALLTGGGITCWGMTSYGQCNIPSGLTASKIAAGGYHTIILTANGGVTAFGRNNYNQTLIPVGLTAKQIAGGEFHSLAIDTFDSLVTWGSNIFGETDIDPSTCDLTSQKICELKSGFFEVGETDCSLCENKVNCCKNGVHSYIFAEQCTATGGTIFEGPEDATLCEYGVFCAGITCDRFGLRGEDPEAEFIVGGNCFDCIKGNCCSEDDEFSYTSQNECFGTFYPGVRNENICSAEVVYGICCTGGICNSNSEQSQCNGYFISAQTSATNNLFCENGACDIGVCCKETTVTSVTGGTCAGIMTRAECALTGGQFFLSSEGYSCTNCQYIPMLSSALFQQIANDTTYSTNQFRRTLLYPGALIGITGAEIQPVNPSLTNADTWLSSGSFNLHGSGATSTLLDFRREKTSLGSKIVFRFARPNFSIFRPWYNSGVTMSGPTLQGLTNGSFDAPPPGLTSDYGGTLGYILGDNFADVYEVPRYLRFVFDYGNPGSTWYGQSLVMRFMGVTRSSTIDSTRSVNYSLDDATKHAGLTLGVYNKLESPIPFRENSATDPFSSPILVQSFAENPLKYRIRPMGSCCKGVTCLGIVTQDQCAFTGGTFYAEENCTGCDRTRILGNCCTGGTYYGYTNEVACLALNGYFKKSATSNPNICIYGSECSSSSFETCITPNIYLDQYSGAAGTTFVSFNYSRNLGCSACDRGICCVDGSCRGYIPREICSDLGGDFYENENACGDLCLTGVCCNLDQPSCGTFTRAGECRGVGKYFFLGYTQGQTCSACSSMTIIPASVAGVDYSYMFNKETTSGTFADGSLWVQETDDLRLLNVTMKYKDGGNESVAYTKLVGGKEHTVGLTELTKHVVGFGDNQYGQCGTTLDYNDDLRLFNFLGQGFKDIAAGFYHTLAVSLGGTVSAWGRNTSGECNVPSGLTGVKAVSAGDEHSVALFENGGVTCWGGNLLGQCNIPVGLSGVTMISCGADHTLAMKSDGTVVAWGNNLEGQCNVPAGLTGVKKVSAGYYHSLALFGAGAGPLFGLTSWGRNVEGQRNHPTTNVIDIAGGGFHTLIIRQESDILVRGYGNNTYGQSQYVYDRNGSHYIAAGEYHSLAIRSDTHFTWGRNNKGQTDVTTECQAKANAKIANLQLRPNGYKGSVYINGIAKNLAPRSYYEADVGRVVGDVQPHTSLHYDNYDEGWKSPLTPLATEVPSNYPAFDLNKFNQYKNSFNSYGITLAAKDIIMCNTTNFNIYNARFPGVQGGYPYQAQQQRANALAIGVITCLSAAQAATAGSTLCFRPPVTWPNELERPLYPVSMINPRVPGQPGMTIIGQGNVDYLKNTEAAVAVKNVCTSFCQVSEFGDGTDYNVITPMWTVNGYGNRRSTYGEQFIFPIADVLQYAYSTTGPDNVIISQDERKDLIVRITQYGLDCWGAMKKFCDNLRSGAGQKASRTRPWIPLAGYFLGITSMYDPEDTLRQDAGRLAKMLEYYYNQPNTVVAGPSGNPPGSCISRKQFYMFRDGDTGPDNNFAGTRRFLARAFAHEPFTTTEFIDDPSNWFRHYNYVGDYYKNTVISGFGPTGATGVTFYNELTERPLVPLKNPTTSFAGVTVYGNFGIIRFGSSAAWQNPFPGRFNFDSKEGHDAAIQGLWLRVESGPGSSGPGGKSRFYKIINSSGFRDKDGGQVPASFGGGSQIVIGQTWADGIPDHTSTIKFYPIIPDAMGYTRPTFYGGYTYGPVGFSIDTNPGDECGTIKAHSAQYQVSINPANTYLANSLKPWFLIYPFLEYIQRTQGVTLISDVVPIMDHIREYVYTSPYNVQSIYFHYRSMSVVQRTWFNEPDFNDPSVQMRRINFQRDYPGVIQWKGMTV